MVLGVINGEDSAIRLIAVYTHTEVRQPDFFRCLVALPGISHSLSLVGDWNAILDSHLDKVGLADRRGESKNPSNLPSCFQLADKYWLDFLNAPMWIRANHIGSSRSYLDRVFCRPVGRSRTCPCFKLVGYTDHKFAICTVDIDRIHRQCPGYWKLKVSSQRAKLSETGLAS